MTQKYYNASQFLAAYFYESFGRYTDPEGAVSDYIKGSSHTSRALAVKELREIIAETPAPELDNMIFGLGCYYKPQKHQGVSMKTWLDQVIARVEQSLEDVP